MNTKKEYVKKMGIHKTNEFFVDFNPPSIEQRKAIIKYKNRQTIIVKFFCYNLLKSFNL